MSMDKNRTATGETDRRQAGTRQAEDRRATVTRQAEDHQQTGMRRDGGRRADEAQIQIAGPVAIRRAAAADIPILAEYEREISVISFGDEAITDPAHHAKRLSKGMEQDPEGMFVLVVEGAVCGWLWMDQKVNYLTQERYANFRSFYIAEAQRGGDAGDRLLTHGLDWCRDQNVRRVVGKVHAGNAPMRVLYRKAGFEATHVTMERTLDASPAHI